MSKPISASMSSMFASGTSCSPMSDIWSLVSSAQAADAAGPPPVGTGSDRPRAPPALAASRSRRPHRFPPQAAAP
eukprot:10108689-Alexandrium_andersonii.AAC.1